MFTTNPLLDGIFRKKKTTRRRAASVTDLPGSMTEAEAEAWMDSTIGTKDLLYGEEFRPFTRLNWSYGKTLRDGLKSMLYRVEVDKESVAEMKNKLRVFHTARNHWIHLARGGVFDRDDKVFIGPAVRTGPRVYNGQTRTADYAYVVGD